MTKGRIVGGEPPVAIHPAAVLAGALPSGGAAAVTIGIRVRPQIPPARGVGNPGHSPGSQTAPRRDRPACGSARRQGRGDPRCGPRDPCCAEAARAVDRGGGGCVQGDDLPPVRRPPRAARGTCGAGDAVAGGGAGGGALPAAVAGKKGRACARPGPTGRMPRHNPDAARGFTKRHHCRLTPSYTNRFGRQCGVKRPGDIRRTL
jgi:hypothetical protein